MKLIDVSRVEIYITDYPEIGKIFSTIRSVSSFKDKPNGKVMPGTKIDCEAYCNCEDSVSFVNNVYKTDCDINFIKAIPHILNNSSNIFNRNGFNEIRENKINALKDIFKDSGKELVFLKQNKNEFPPRIKSVDVSIIKNLTDKKYLNFPECVELSVKTNDGFEIIIHVSQNAFDVKEFHCDVCVNDGVVSFDKDEFDILISKVIPIFDNHDIESHHLAEEKLCDHFKQNLPHICNDYSIKILNCYNEEGNKYNIG